LNQDAAAGLRAGVGHEQMRDASPFAPCERFNRTVDDAISLVNHTIEIEEKRLHIHPRSVP
jgi:hypothetical protein